MSLIGYNSVDEVLGASESRYFGAGYLNTSYALSGNEIAEANDHVQFACTGTVELPQLWSVKGNTKQRPHLSSIDAIELSIACLSEQLRSLPYRGSYSVSAITVLAGHEPTEDGLNNLLIRGKLRFDQADKGAVELQIANMKTRLDFAMTGTGDEYSSSHHPHPVAVKDVMLDLNDLKASALVHPLRQEPTQRWALASCFAAALQVGQVLLYKLDRMSRAESHTLWMRKLSIGVFSSLPSLTSPQPMHTTLQNVKRFEMEGTPWRCADIASWFSNTKIVCSVAHRIS